jgi:hypothetical protein
LFLYSFLQKPDTFSRPLIDQFAKEGKDKKVVFEAQFTKPNCKPKWYYRKDEIFPSSKYKMVNEGEVYKLVISAPRVEDSGKYTCEINAITCFASLSVEEPDPTYNFVKMLDKKCKGYFTHDFDLECAVNSGKAQVYWTKNGERIGEFFK